MIEESINLMIAALKADLATLSTQVKVTADAREESLRIDLPGGKWITIKRSPLAKYRNGDSFDVWMSPTRPGMGGDVALSKSAREVFELVQRYVAASALNQGRQGKPS